MGVRGWEEGWVFKKPCPHTRPTLSLRTHCHYCLTREPPGWGVVKALASAAWPVGFKEDHPEKGHALLGLQVRAEVCPGGRQAGPARGVEEGWEPPQVDRSGNMYATVPSSS